MSDAIFKSAHAGIQKLHAYQPGKPIDELKRELGLTSIIKLASNENPLGTAPSALKALASWQDELSIYPDGNGYTLKQALAKRHDIATDRITLGNGSNDVLELVARIFLGPGKNAVFSAYSFAVYPIATLGVNGEPRTVPALPADHPDMPYGHDLSAFADYIDDQTGVVFIASPNNPTGTWFGADELEQLLEKIPSHVAVVLDEAYVEYQEADKQIDSRALLERFSNLVVMRTFSKIFGMAGLRVGYALSSPAMADLLNRIRQPFNVNALALHCATAAVEDMSFVESSYQSNRQEIVWLSEQLNNRGLNCLPSQANFITFNCHRPSTPVYDGLLRQGVIVRPLASYEMPEHLRVTVGNREQNSRFLAALDEVLAS